MPRRTHSQLPRAGRYTDAEIAQRVEDLRRRRNLLAKQLAAAVGVLESQYSKKVRCDGSTFTVEEIGLIADELDAPPGWPFLDEDAGEFLTAALKMLARIQ